MAKQTLNMDKMYKDLLKRYHEVSNLNIGLLEEKRELLLRSQDNSRRPTNDENVLEPIQTRNNENVEKDSEDENSYFLGSKLSCSCPSGKYIQELVKVNHTWQEKYEALKSKTRLLESNFETGILKQQVELQQEIEENRRLRELVDKLSLDLQNVSPEFHGAKKNTEERARDQIYYTADDIEALKQQLLAYQEDFEIERKDKAKAHNENKVLQEKLQQADSQIKSISDERRRYRQCFGEVSQQKEHLISELRRISTSSLPFSPVHQLPRNDHLSTANDFIPRSSAGPSLIRAPPGAYMGAKAYED